MTRSEPGLRGEGPLIAVAVHNGHAIRDELAGLFALSEDGRLREEDPYTGEWAEVAPTSIVAHHSRFEVDLNRPRDKAVYRRPEDAWGLQVWKEELPTAVVERSLAEYDHFYDLARETLSAIARRWGRFVVFDLHTYNHRQDGPDGPPADPDMNPELNLGTGTMDRTRWAPVVDRFLHDLRAFDFRGRSLDVRENVKFRGGRFSRFVHEEFPDTGVSLAIEFKKTFMDEWTGERDRAHFDALKAALASTVPGVLATLK
ncbi:MAG: N-formylglutamate amidohydrolase [Planctomycetota bacterium]